VFEAKGTDSQMYFSFLAAGFCPKNLTFARKMMALPESWGLQTHSPPGSYAYAIVLEWIAPMNYNCPHP